MSSSGCTPHNWSVNMVLLLWQSKAHYSGHHLFISVLPYHDLFCEGEKSLDVGLALGAQLAGDCRHQFA